MFVVLFVFQISSLPCCISDEPPLCTTAQSLNNRVYGGWSKDSPVGQDPLHSWELEEPKSFAHHRKKDGVTLRSLVFSSWLSHGPPLPCMLCCRGQDLHGGIGALLPVPEGLKGRRGGRRRRKKMMRECASLFVLLNRQPLPSFQNCVWRLPVCVCVCL